MRMHFLKLALFAVCIGLFVFLFGQQTYGQKAKHIRFMNILVRLTSASPTSTSVKKLNEQLISNVRKQKVNFIIDADDEKTLRKAGSSSLIKAIRKNVNKDIDAILKTNAEKRVLYKKFTDNYNGNIEQKKTALEAAEEFVRKYSDDADNDDDIIEVIRYFREAIPYFEKIIARPACDCK